MNNGMVDETTEDVIITIDNGIAAIDAIDYAVRSGKEVCVIDHHHMRDDEKLPQASIIIDPHVTGGYNGYCAAGLALRLAEILVPTSTRLMHWRALAAIATVADVVPLIGDIARVFADPDYAQSGGYSLFLQLRGLLRNALIQRRGDFLPK